MVRKEDAHTAADLASDRFVGHVDSSDGNKISGWAFDPHRPEDRLDIGVYLGGECLFTFRADRFRQDLLEIGYGDGRHGFEVTTPTELFMTPFVVLQVRFMEGGRELIGSPVAARNNRLSLDETALAMFGQAIGAVSAAAETAGALDGLGAWLTHHHELVYRRQTSLARSAAHRDIWFTEFVAQKRSLTNLLQEAAHATVAQYDTLHLDEVADPEVTVIVPVYNQFAYTYRCVQAILAHMPAVPFEIVVTDDGSTDETLYAALVLFGGIRIVRNARNGGFLQAVNAAVAVARGRYLFLLNNDTEVQDGWLDALLRTFAHDPAIGVAGSKLISPDGRLQEAGAIVWRQGTAMNWGRSEDPNDPRFCFMRDADYVSGAALMIERSLFDAVGGLSEEFAPAYYEDTDLCFKVRAAGRRVVVQPRSRVMHHEGVTAGTDVGGPLMKRFQRLNHRTFLLKWFETLQLHGLSGADPHLESERGVTKRLLFIDNTVPTPDQDAGSNVAVQYMLGLQRLGFKVSFVGADNLAKISPYTDILEGYGIQCYYHPYSPSVESIIHDGAALFDVFFVHRPTNMEKYSDLIRQRFPKALIVYCMADIHHLRLEREADVTQDKALRREAREMKKTELAMVMAADTVIVHSSFEAAFIERAVPTASVHLIPWAVPARPTPVAFGDRKGLALIGGYNHTPNADAAVWLVNEIMPLVWAQDPAIECLLIGSQMPPAIQALGRPGVRILGHLPDLQPTLDGLRLTVAPLRYGAGLKGKVLTSLAAGVPCVATPCATEGMNLPKALDALVAETAEDFAAKILLAYHDQALNAALGQAGLGYIEATCSRDRVDELLRAATSRQDKSVGLRLAMAAASAGGGAAETPRQDKGKKNRKPKPGPLANGAGTPSYNR